MKKLIKSSLSLIIALLICVSVIPINSTATDYPEGITASQAEDAIDNTDILIKELLNRFGNTSLSQLLMPEICSDKFLSNIVTEAYKALEKNSESLAPLGLKISVTDVAAYLSMYPNVSSTLSSCTSWEQVDPSLLNWGITDKKSFAVAASAAFGPLNSLMYVLLCGGTYPIIGALVGITGAKGYENSILPIYECLGCTDYLAPANFYSEAASDKHTMIRNIVLDLLDYVEVILDSPATQLTENLPSIAYFVNNGGLDKAISDLMSPLKISVLGAIPILSIDTFIDMSALENGINININLEGSSASSFVTAPLDLDTFASCGTVSGNRVIPKKGDVYIEFLRWALETVKLNQSTVTSLISTSVENTGELDINSLVTNLLSKPTDEIIAILVNLLASEGGTVNSYQWSFMNKRENTAVYTENLTKEDFDRAVSEADTLVNQFVAEGDEYTTLREMLEPMLYSNSLLSQVVSEVYKFFEDEEIRKFAELLNINLEPSVVAQSLQEEQFSSAREQLSNLSSWQYVNTETLSWGFEDGDKEGFIEAATAVLRPANSLFSVLLCGDKLTLFDAIDFYGSDGYNTAIIPLLEALGVYGEDILSYTEYVAATKNGDVIKPILNSIFSLVDRFLDKPVNTLTEILPNLMYFLNNKGLSICVKNLLYPVMSILDSLGLSDLVDLSALSDIDVNSLISKLTENFEINFSFAELNLSQFEGMGELVTVNSKRTQNSMPIQIYAVEADKAAVLVTVLRYAVETIKLPGNDSVIISLLDGTEMGENSMVSTLVQGIADKITAMTVDETVEWVFDIFFAERVTVETLNTDPYVPHIIYESKNSFFTGTVATVTLIIAMIFIVFILINRDKIKFFLQDLKNGNAASNKRR